jgi:hypothetical protein
VDAKTINILPDATVSDVRPIARARALDGASQSMTELLLVS